MTTNATTAPVRSRAARIRVAMLVAVAAVALPLLSMARPAEASNKPDIKTTVGVFSGHGFGVKLKNIGTAGTGSFGLEIDAAQLHVMTIANIPPGESRYITLPNAPCNQSVRAVADFTHLTGDANYGNNTAYGTQTICGSFEGDTEYHGISNE